MMDSRTVLVTGIAAGIGAALPRTLADSGYAVIGLDRVPCDIAGAEVMVCDLADADAIEQALIGTPVTNASQPVEVLRVVHSFDPCMACACHAFDPSGRKIGVAKIL